MAAASERVFEFLEEAEEVQTAEHPLELANVEGNVDFQHVSFGYQPEQCVIHDFSAKVKSGQKIAIVGPTGAGKTTMVKLLMRFYDVSGGAILLDGHDVRDFDRHKLGPSITTAPFASSLSFNISSTIRGLYSLIISHLQ